MYISRPLTFVFRDVVGGHKIISTNGNSFFVPDFYRIHESYDTVFLGLTLYSSYKVLKRNRVRVVVSRVVKAFIFVTVAAQGKDYEIIDKQKLNSFICLLVLTVCKFFLEKHLNNNKKLQRKYNESPQSLKLKCKQLTYVICIMVDDT